MFVIPKEGLIVLNPMTRKPISVDGQEVPANSYWQRRLDDGDVSLQSETAPLTNLTPKEERKTS